MLSQLLTSFAILALALVIGWLCIHLIGPHGFLDIPGGRRDHPHPVPRVGGLACFATILLSAKLLDNTISLSQVQWLALGITLLTGALDDRFDLPARWKVVVSLTVALALAWASLDDLAGVLSHIRLLSFVVPYSPLLAFALFLMLYWGIPQAFNLIDGANGLAIGYALIISLVLYVDGTITQRIPIILLGLLALNWPKPRLFLGDCGALTLGLLFAILAHKAFSATQANAILWLFAYPIVDVTLVVAIRAVNGQSLIRGDRNHLHHQLADRLGRLAFLAVPILWLLAGLCASRAMGWTTPAWTGLGALLGMAAAFFAAGLKKRTADFNTDV